MQSDQQLIVQLRDAVGSARRTIEETKQRHKARIAALRAEQRREIEGIQAVVRGYEKALKAVTQSNGERDPVANEFLMKQRRARHRTRS